MKKRHKKDIVGWLVGWWVEGTNKKSQKRAFNFRKKMYQKRFFSIDEISVVFQRNQQKKHKEFLRKEDKTYDRKKRNKKKTKT